MAMNNSDFRQIYASERINADEITEGIKAEHKVLLDGFHESISDLAESQEPRQSVKLSERLTKIGDIFLPHFVRADRLALKYQNLYVKGSKLIYILSVIAVLAVSAQYIFSLPHEILVLEIASILCILFIILWGNKIGWHRRWLDYRLLAERFRFAVFMAMVGEKVSIQFSESDIHHAHETGHWVFMHFREVWEKWGDNHNPLPSDQGSVQIMKRFINICWLENQRVYHENNVQKQLRKHKFLSLASEALFFLTLVAVLLHFFHFGGDLLSPYLTFTAILFPASGSAFSALRAHFEHNRLARRSAAIAKHLEGIQQRVSAVNDMDGLLAVVREAEELMLNDNADWHVMIGVHHLEPPG